MFDPKRAARWLNVLLPAFGLGAALFLFCGPDLSSMPLALLLSLLAAGLLAWGLFLQRTQKGNDKNTIQEGRRRAAELLARLPYEEALDRAFAALQKRYRLERIGQSKEMILADCSGETICVALAQGPDETGVRDVQRFQQQRGGLKGVLLCLGPIRGAAQSYADGCAPKLRLMPLLPLLAPLPEKKKTPDKKSFARELNRLLFSSLNRRQALRCLRTALFLLLLFILTDRLLYLLPGLMLLFWACLASVRRGEEEELFEKA